MAHPLSEEDFPRIEAEMQKIVKADERFERLDMPRDEALELCRELKQEFKVEHIETGLADEKSLSFYRQGEFIDLCRGPHIPSTGHIGTAFKLLSVAGAYWKGDAVARAAAAALRHRVLRQEGARRPSRAARRSQAPRPPRARQAARAVHHQPDRRLRPDPVAAQGRDHPPDARRLHQGRAPQARLQPVYTPNIGRVELYQISGHFPYYSDSQFPPIEFEDGERYLLKPMNCPHHIMIYKAKPRSYRDLPVRLAEFGTVYRFEQSGELRGMTRVRGFTQDDAHLFCTEEQVADEFRGCLEMTQTVLASLGMNDYRVRLGFRDPKSDKYVGGERSLGPGRGGAQGGVRIDEPAGHVDRAGRGGVLRAEGRLRGHRLHRPRVAARHRAARLQPAEQERFDLEYIGADNQPHQPVMIHRAPLGSMERFIGVLIEHFAGAFPLWLAPEQVRVLTVSEKSEAYGREVESQAGRRRPARQRRLPRRKAQRQNPRRPGRADPVHVRRRREGPRRRHRRRPRPARRRPEEPLPLAAAIAKLRDEIDAKTVRQVASPPTRRRGRPRKSKRVLDR